MAALVGDSRLLILNFNLCAEMPLTALSTYRTSQLDTVDAHVDVLCC